MTANTWLTAVGWTFHMVFLAVTIYLVRRALRQPGGARKAAYWAVTVVFTFAAVRWLSVNNNEFIHFFQYALLTFPIFALTRSFGQTAVWTTLCGAGLGVVWICSMATTRPVLNSVKSLAARQLSGWGWRTALGLLAVGFLMLASGHMMVYEPKMGPKPLVSLSRLEPKPFWFFDATWGPKTFHILHPAEGVLLMALLFCFYSSLDRYWEWNAKAVSPER